MVIGCVHCVLWINRSTPTKCMDTIFYNQPYTAISHFSGQSIQEDMINIFIPPAIHSTVCIPPVTLEIHPPMMAPTKMPVNASALRFLFTFFRSGLASSGSDAISYSMLVTTTVGISLKFKLRLPTSWPADWKLSSAIGISSFQSMGWPTACTVLAITPAWISAAGMKMRRDCSRKEATRVLRRRGPRRRQKREKKNAPRTKQMMEVSDFAQP